MRFLEKSHDGGKNSGVTGFFLLEIKPLFSILLIRFENSTRDAFHSHAFNALTIWLKGSVTEKLLNGTTLHWSAGDFKWTPRGNFHKVLVEDTAWALSFRGPWKKQWQEVRGNRLITLENGRKEVKETYIE